MKKLVQVWTALLLTLTLVCPARAAGGLTLQMQGTDNVRLTLQNLGSREVNSVQLELTLNGSYPRAAFASDASSEQYSFCRVEEENGRTQITLYVDSLRSLNQNGTATFWTGGWSRAGRSRLSRCEATLKTAADQVADQVANRAVETTPSTPPVRGTARFPCVRPAPGGGRTSR